MSDNEKNKQEIIEDCSNSDVVTKYRLAADITNTALMGVITQCLPGKNVIEVCSFGDAIIEKRCASVFKAKKVDKGIAFPTCVSVNDVVCHYSPIPGEATTLKAGDWVKIDLGCHIDGYIAVVAHTYVVPTEPGEVYQFTGREADILMATYQAAEVCAKMIKPGNKNHEVTAAIANVAKAFDVFPVPGTQMHQLKRFVIDGNKVIAQKQEIEQKVEECTFETNEVWTVDVCFSTGDSKVVAGEERTTVFKRCVDKNYRLKMKSSRYVLNETNNRYPTLPFTIRSMEDEHQARMGVVECVKHELLQPYPVLHSHSGDLFAHFKCTVLLLPSGTAKITGIPLDLNRISTEKTVDEETAAILATSSKKKKNKRSTQSEGDRDKIIKS